MPARRNQTLGQVGEWRQDEEAFGRRWVRDLEQAARFRRIDGGVTRASCSGAIDRQPGPPEDEQVEVELARPPATSRLAAKGDLEALEGDQQERRTGGEIGSRGEIERDRGVPELRLIRVADRSGGIEPRDGHESRIRQRRESMNCGGQGPGRVPEIGPQAHVGSNPPLRQAALHEPGIEETGCRAPYTRTVRPITVLIFHPQAGPGSGILERRLALATERLARVHEAGFLRAGATTVRIIAGPPDGLPFGSRLAQALRDVPDGGLILLGSGAIPLAGLVDRRTFVACAGGGGMAVTNNRFSSDVLAVADAGWLRAVPADLATDNVLPRWLSEQAGIPVADLRARQRLGVDLDSPLDLVLLGRRGASIDPGAHPEDAPVIERLAGIRRVLDDAAAELVIAGRTSAAVLSWLEGFARCRVRALVEERGLRASVRLPTDPPQRPPRSVLGSILDSDGPAALGARLAELGDAALIDSRVLLAHRLGADESTWPVAEERFASDLLQAEAIGDPWLAELTRSAAGATIPILLGGHSLVGPGIRLVATA